MSNDNQTGQIGLSDLIRQVKQDLLSASAEETGIPLFSVDSVELELQVTLKKEGKAGVKIYVLELGGGSSRNDVQTIKVKLSPLLSKDKLLVSYQEKNPEAVQEFVAKSIEALMKGSGDAGVSQQFD